MKSLTKVCNESSSDEMEEGELGKGIRGPDQTSQGECFLVWFI